MFLLTIEHNHMACWTVRMSLDTEENTSNRRRKRRITTDSTDLRLEKTELMWVFFFV